MASSCLLCTSFLPLGQIFIKGMICPDFRPLQLCTPHVCHFTNFHSSASIQLTSIPPLISPNFTRRLTLTSSYPLLLPLFILYLFLSPLSVTHYTPSVSIIFLNTTQTSLTSLPARKASLLLCVLASSLRSHSFRRTSQAAPYHSSSLPTFPSQLDYLLSIHNPNIPRSSLSPTLSICVIQGLHPSSRNMLKPPNIPE